MTVEKFGNYWFDINDIVAISEPNESALSLNEIEVYVKYSEKPFWVPNGEEAERCLEMFKKSKSPRILDKKPR